MVRDMIRVYKETRKELRVDVTREAKLKAKYNDVVVGLDENLIVVSLRKELKSLKGQLKEHEVDYDKLLLDERKWVGQKESIIMIESKCDGLKKERDRLRETKIKLQGKIDGLKLRCKMLKQDKAEVISKVVSYISMEPYHCDEVGQNVENLVKAAIFHERCSALEEMAATKKPVDLSKVECYRPSDEEEYNKAGNAFVTTEYPFLIEATRDPSTALEDLLSKKPRSLKPPTLTKKPSPEKLQSFAPAITMKKLVSHNPTSE
uniref:Uncharacterized protein n=1 Tax=Tanacetum cinerariifolium TaxID=118510 RepID=A0A699IVN4_TANCI|nr:hypothetical protein [Tanacetum cinerariifolium]